MGNIIRVAHDFACPWCWIGWHQSRRLRSEFDVQFEWLSYELHPDGVELPPSPLPVMPGYERPTRLQLAYAAEGMEPPQTPRLEGRTHNAHEAVEFARTEGTHEALIAAIYHAWWVEGRDYNNPQELALIASGIVSDTSEMLEAIAVRRYADRITQFDQPAYDTGVRFVPTFWIGGKRYAEQPYSVLRSAMVDWLGDPVPYSELTFPPAKPDRPYVFINMVATIDGKTVSGDRNEPVQDLGSPMDHRVMRLIESAADAVLIGAGSLRATKGLWYPERLWRFVATRSGDVPAGRFFSDAPSKVGVLAPASATVELPALRLDIDGGFLLALTRMRTELGIEHLLVEGGSELNAALLKEGLVDELFLTLAPKVKLGRSTPTYAGGEPLDRSAIQGFRLVENHQVGDELFLRYRRRHD